MAEDKAPANTNKKSLEIHDLDSAPERLDEIRGGWKIADRKFVGLFGPPPLVDGYPGETTVW